MEEIGLAIPKIHDLKALSGSLTPHHPTLKSLRRGLVFLSDFAVENRYPGADATKRQAIAAVRWAGKVREQGASLIGHALKQRSNGRSYSFPRNRSTGQHPGQCSLPDLRGWLARS